VEYPKWSEISGLVGRLRKRKHADCITAAENLEEFHSRLHNTTGELETSQERIAKLGYMIEDAAAKAELQREGDTLRACAIPSEAWFRLVGYYRPQQDGGFTGIMPSTQRAKDSIDSSGSR